MPVILIGSRTVKSIGTPMLIIGDMRSQGKRDAYAVDLARNIQGFPPWAMSKI
jgi:hypothetical protein